MIVASTAASSRRRCNIAKIAGLLLVGALAIHGSGASADQIAAMFRDVTRLSTRYATGVASRAIPKSVTFEQYVETKHHGGWSNKSWDRYEKGYDFKIRSFGLHLVPKRP
jgi:hypothetical protein